MINESSSWLQWGFGVWVTLTTAIGMHLYSRIETLRREIEEESDNQMDRIRKSLDELRREMEQDRKSRTADGLLIAGTMVTRNELDKQVEKIERQIDRVLVELSKHHSPRGQSHAG